MLGISPFSYGLVIQQGKSREISFVSENGYVHVKRGVCRKGLNFNVTDYVALPTFARPPPQTSRAIYLSLRLSLPSIFLSLPSIFLSLYQFLQLSITHFGQYLDQFLTDLLILRDIGTRGSNPMFWPKCRITMNLRMLTTRNIDMLHLKTIID